MTDRQYGLYDNQRVTSDGIPWWVEDGDVTIPVDGPGAIYLSGFDLAEMVTAVQPKFTLPWADNEDGSCGYCGAKPGDTHHRKCENYLAIIRRGH